MIDGYAAFVRLQAFFRAPCKHAAVRSKLVAVVVARLEPQKCGDLGPERRQNSSSSPELFSEAGKTAGNRTARVDHS